MNCSIPKLIAVLAICLLNTCTTDNYTIIIDSKHIVQPSIYHRKDKTPDFQAMLTSFQEIGNLFAMTFHGDFDELISYHHHQIMAHFRTQDSLIQNKRHCSLFTYFDEAGRMYLGRNFDNRNTDVLIGLFIPDSGYASIGFIPLIELRFDTRNPFDPTADEHRRLLLHSAAVTVDGMNEKGVTVSVASVSRQSVAPDSTKPYRYLLHLKRNILDHAHDVESAIDIAAGYNVFDNAKHIIEHHLLVADPSGASVVLEWHEGKMQVIRDETNWQIATNTKILNTPAKQLRKSCNRYNSIYKCLSNVPDTLSWQLGMDALASSAQQNQTYYFASGPLKVNTKWSAIFDLSERIVYISLDRQYDTVYKFQLHNKEFYDKL